MTDKILTICIPTYNRKIYLEKQLGFFQRQIDNNKKILERVHFIVSDNASTDDTLFMLNSWSQDSLFFDYYINEVNLGLAGNLKASLNRSITEYFWFVSDDDRLKDGIIELVLDAIDSSNPEFILINYLSGGNNKEIGYTGTTGFHTNSKSVALEIFNEAYGSLVFITACVYKRSNLLDLENDEMSAWISVPLFYSFYSCSKGAMFIIQDPMIIFNHGNASYAGTKKVLKIKFEEYIKILERLSVFDYDRDEVLRTIKLFFKQQSHSHFLYNFVNLGKSLKYYKYYDLKTIVYFPVNIIKFISRKN